MAWLKWIGAILAIIATAGGGLLFLVQTDAEAIADHALLTPLVDHRAHVEKGHPTTELRLERLEESDKAQTKLLHRIDKKLSLTADRVGVRKSKLREIEENE